MLAFAIIALMVVVGVINPRFVAERNLQSIFLGNAYIAVAAIGMSMVIISGNIDISVGSLIGVLATISGTLAVAGVPIILAWIIPVVISIAFTTLMGAMVAYLRIPSIVVSLGIPVDPERRTDQRYRRRLDQQAAATASTWRR